jgi:hypothetical protein
MTSSETEFKQNYQTHLKHLKCWHRLKIDQGESV